MKKKTSSRSRDTRPYITFELAKSILSGCRRTRRKQGNVSYWVWTSGSTYYAHSAANDTQVWFTDTDRYVGLVFDEDKAEVLMELHS